MFKNMTTTDLYRTWTTDFLDFVQEYNVVYYVNSDDTIGLSFPDEETKLLFHLKFK